MRYVGIDPSTKTGIVIIDEFENEIYINELTTKVDKDPERFMDIAQKVILRLPGGKERFVICIEGFSYGSKGAGVSTQYGIGWLIRSELIRNGYKYTEVPPSSLKKFATGKGNCSKDSMVLPIYKRWGFENDSDNIRDAYVLAQIARAMNEDIELTAFQKDVMKKVGA